MTESTRPEGLNGENSVNTSKKGESTMSTDEKEQKRISRREFVKGAAVGAAGVAAAGVLASCAPAATPCPTPEVIKETVEVPVEVIKEVEVKPWLPKKWDYEVDVVVLGTGSVIPAALTAHDAGAKVLILEKQKSFFGGTTAFSGGAVSCPNNRFIEEAGLTVPRDVILAYMKKCAEGQSTDELLETLLDNYNPTFNYLMDYCGFDLYWMDDPTPFFAWYTPHFEDEPVNPGVSQTLWAVPREGAARSGEESGVVASGHALMAYARDAVDERGIEILFGTQGKKLIYAGNSDMGNGEVIGIMAISPEGKEINIKARRGVVIGTGGFDHNREMLQHFLPGPIQSTVALDTNTGDGHLMGMAVGAQLRNMNEAFRMAYVMPSGSDLYAGIDPYADIQIKHMLATAGGTGGPGKIIVNRFGDRFVNEACNYDTFGKAFEVHDTGLTGWRNVPAFIICGGDFYEHYNLPYQTAEAKEAGEVPEWITQADTLDDLATKLGIDGDRLKATVEKFNGYARTGVDPDFHRGESTFDRWTSGDSARYESGELKNSCLAPLDSPPYFGYNVWPGLLQTKGGLQINTNAQVLNVWGKVIPRLYCSSCTMAMPMGRGYGWAGSTMAPGFVFGYLAGKHVATLAPWG